MKRYGIYGCHRDVVVRGWGRHRADALGLSLGGDRGTGAFGHHGDVEVLGLWLKYINQSKLIYKAQ